MEYDSLVARATPKGRARTAPESTLIWTSNIPAEKRPKRRFGAGFEQRNALVRSVPSGASVELAAAVDFFDDMARSRLQDENLKFWKSRIEKPVVSLTDTKLLSAMVAAKEAAERTEEAKRQAEKNAAEKAKHDELEQKLQSF